MTLALITGRGALPVAVAKAQSNPPLICALENHETQTLKPDLTFSVETLGRLLHQLTQRGVKEVCFCGSIDRPKLAPWRLDIRTVPLVPAMRKALKGGEDSALRVLISIFEDRGFVVKGAHELAPELLPDAGVLTRKQPPQDIEENLNVARNVANEQGRRDLGQSCVIRAGQVIAQEDSHGTDAMLRGLVRPNEPIPMGHRGVFFKSPKPGQDRRVDLPTIGPETARSAVAANLDGLVIDAGGVLILDQDEVVKILDDAGLFLWVR